VIAQLTSRARCQAVSEPDAQPSVVRLIGANGSDSGRSGRFGHHQWQSQLLPVWLLNPFPIFVHIQSFNTKQSAFGKLL
jgi:hypothetical protein